MSSDLFTARVLTRAKTSIVFEVTDTHHGVAAPWTVGFFFSLLYELAQAKCAPLASACSPEQMCDETFVVANAARFIASVEVIAAVSASSATYRVETTDAKWSKHVEPGMPFGTTSYDLGKPVLRARLRRLAPRSKKAATPTADPVAPRTVQANHAMAVVFDSALGKRSVTIGVERKHPLAPSPMTCAFLGRALRALGQRRVARPAAHDILALDPPSSCIERFRGNGFRVTKDGEVDLYVIDLKWPVPSPAPKSWTHEKILGPLKKGAKATLQSADSSLSPNPSPT